MENVLFDFVSKHMILTEEEKQVITELNLFRTYKKGTVLLKEGEYSKTSYFVVKGCIRCFYVIDGEEKTTAFYTEKQGIEPSCIFDNSPSEYYLACVEDSILTVSNPNLEAEMFEKFPRFERLCRVLYEKNLAKKQNSFDEFRISSPEQRYLNLLKSRPELLQRVPQYQLASYLGMKPQSLSRMRARIRNKSK